MPCNSTLPAYARRRTQKMKPRIVAAALALFPPLLFSSSLLAGTFVYVTNAEDGDIGIYSLQPDGSLQPGARVAAAKVVMPLAVSPDRRFLYAGVRSKPFSVYTYSIDAANGALKQLSTGPLHESFPYISTDRTRRFLFCASYRAHLVS